MSVKSRYWLWVAGWLTLIYATLYLVPFAVKFLQRHIPFDTVITIFLYSVLTGLIVGYVLRRGFRKVSSYFLCLLVVFCYAYGVSKVRFPAEKIHFLQYGFLAYLIYRALRLDVKRPLAYIFSFILTGVFGWIDEGIQNFLPNRYYELVDVQLNCICAALGLSLVYIFERERSEQG